jgi:hypothetical protein
MVISGVTERLAAPPGAIRALVFLDAFVPADGESLADLASPAVRETLAGLAARGAPTMPPIPAAAFRVNEQDRAWVDAKCTPQPLATLTDRIALTGARGRIAPKVYVRAVGYPSAGSKPREQGWRATPAGACWRSPAGTTPWWTCPSAWRRSWWRPLSDTKLLALAREHRNGTLGGFLPNKSRAPPSNRRCPQVRPAAGGNVWGETGPVAATARLDYLFRSMYLFGGRHNGPEKGDGRGETAAASQSAKRVWPPQGAPQGVTTSTGLSPRPSRVNPWRGIISTTPD